MRRRVVPAVAALAVLLAAGLFGWSQCTPVAAPTATVAPLALTGGFGPGAFVADQSSSRSGTFLGSFLRGASSFAPGAGGSAGVQLELDGLIVIAGQSNAVGQGNTSNADSGLLMTSVFAGATIDTHIAAAAGDPPTYVNVARRDLQPYAAGGSPGMGVELSLGRWLATYNGMPTPIAIAKMAINGIQIASWLPAATYPTTPPNLYTQFLAYIDAQAAAVSKPLGAIIWIQGESDATQDVNANAYAANLDTLFGALRAEYGETWLLVIVGLNPEQIAGTITQTRFDTVRAAQQAYVAAHSENTIFVAPDRVPIGNGDNLHYLVDEYWSLGNTIGEAVAAKLKPNRDDSIGSGPAPRIQYISEPALWSSTGTAALTIRGPPVHRAGDRDFLILGTGALEAAPVLDSAAGFTLVPGATAQSQVSTTIDTYCHVYTRVADSSAIAAGGGRLADPVRQDNNNNSIGFIVTVRGSDTTSAGIDAVSSNVNNASNTTANITGVTTTGANRLVLFFQTTFSGSNNAASWANATLPDFAVDRDSINPMNVTVTVGHGTLAAAGSSGNVTGTRAAASTTASVAIAVAP
jgi:hypothetical protein